MVKFLNKLITDFLSNYCYLNGLVSNYFINDLVMPSAYLAWKFHDCSVLNIPPGEVVISKYLISNIFEHPHVKAYHEWFLRIWSLGMSIDYIWLMPCTSKKPYVRSVTYKMVKYYVKRLKEVGINVELIAVSEPMGLVPIEFCTYYPVANYDYPPRLMDENDRELMITLLIRLFKKLLKMSIRNYIVATLPKHHARILNNVIERLGEKIKEKVILVPYGRKTFKTLRKVYESILSNQVKSLCMGVE